MGPIDYSIDVASPFQSALQGFKAGSEIRQVLDQRELAEQQRIADLEKQKQLQAAYAETARNPTADSVMKLMLLDPKSSEAINRAWTVKNTQQQQSLASDLLKWGAAIKSGSPEIAASQMEKRADEIEAQTGAPTQDSQALRTQANVMRQNPAFALGQIQALLSANPQGKDAAETLSKFGAEQREQAKAPAELAKTEAEAKSAQTAALFAAPKARADIANINSQISDRAARLGMDQDKMTSEFQLKVQELRRKPGAIDLPDSALKIVNEAAGNSVVARNAASQFEGLASQFEAADPASFGASAYEFLKRTTGQQDYVSSLRKEYVRLRSSEVNKMMPPGASSDADVANAMAGFLPETANAKELASFMRGLAKLNNYHAKIEEARSEWAGAVGNLGKAARDVEIGGVAVPAGTTFAEFVKRTQKPPGPATESPAASAKARLMQKYGGGASGSY